jgi:hypothetical protein
MTNLPKAKAKSNPDLSKKLEFFNRNHAVVTVGGKVLIVREIREENSDYVKEVNFFKESDLRTLFKNDHVFLEGEDGKLKKINSFAWWLEQKGRREYVRGCEFHPLANHSQVYNMWAGFAFKPAPGDWGLLKSHILDVICDGNDLMYDYLIKWLAFSFQKANQPQGSAVILRGSKGCGKGMLGNFVNSIWGRHGLQIARPSHLIGKFNKHLWDKCFIFADEAYFAADKKDEGALKALVTEKDIVIEAKGMDAIKQRNYLKVLMATNSEWAVPASKDERRWAVYDVSDKRIGDWDYFKTLGEFCDLESVKAAFLYDMLNMDISKYSTAQIVESDGLKDQRLHSLDSVAQFIFEGLSQGYFKIADDESDEWKTQVGTTELFNSYIFWCDSLKKGEYARKTHDCFSKYLVKIFGKSKRLAGGGKRVVVLRSIEEARELFTKYEKVAFTADDDDDNEKPQASEKLLEAALAVIDEQSHYDMNSVELEKLKTLLNHAFRMGKDILDVAETFADNFVAKRKGLNDNMAFSKALESVEY